MNIRYSRNAKRRMKLYDISEKNVLELVEGVETKGKHTLVKNIPGFKYPIKIIFDLDVNFITGISVYPLKRSYK